MKLNPARERKTSKCGLEAMQLARGRGQRTSLLGTHAFEAP